MMDLTFVTTALPFGMRRIGVRNTPYLSRMHARP